MALTKPIGIPISAFDAYDGQEFSFNAVGGDQVVGNTIFIYDENFNVKYSNYKSTYDFSQTVLTNAITNGNKYYFSFQTKNINNQESQLSEKVPFYCYTEPNIIFSPKQATISNSNYTFNAYYTQVEGEYLNNYVFELYNATNNMLVSKSDTYFARQEDHTPFNETGVEYHMKHTFENMIEGERYYVVVKTNTIYNTSVVSEKYEFNVKYGKDRLYNILDCENFCNKGYIRIESKVNIIDGKINNPIYENNKLDLSNENNKLLWDKGFSIESEDNNLFRLWFTPTLTNSTIAVFEKNQRTYYEIQFRRGRLRQPVEGINPYIIRKGNVEVYTDADGNVLTDVNSNVLTSESEETEIYYLADYFELRGFTDGVLNVYVRSQYFNLLNSTSQVFIELNKDKDSNEQFNVKLLSQEETVVEWNNNYSNLKINGLSDIFYDEEFLNNYIIDMQNFYSDISKNIYPIKKIELTNGVFDYFSVEKNTNYTEEEKIQQPTEWDNTTIMICNFNNNVQAGNIPKIDGIKALRLQRIEEGSTEWIPLIDKQINRLEDYNFVYYDAFVPNATRVRYALLPILQGNAYGDVLLSDTVESKFSSIYISEYNNQTKTTTMFELKFNSAIGGENQNIQTGTLLPIYSKYPVVVQNSATNYKTGSFSGDLLGYGYYSNTAIPFIDKIDRKNIVQQKNDMLKFLTNGLPKIIKDWNGNILLCRVTDNPSVTYNNSYGGGIVNISFNYVEQGEWNNKQDMIDNGLSDLVLY